jgi:hypothetical protein
MCGGCLVVASLAERIAQPFETLIKTVSRRSASGLNVLMQVSDVTQKSSQGSTYPGALPEAVEAKLVGDLGSVHGILGR